MSPPSCGRVRALVLGRCRRAVSSPGVALAQCATLPSTGHLVGWEPHRRHGGGTAPVIGAARRLGVRRRVRDPVPSAGLAAGEQHLVLVGHEDSVTAALHFRRTVPPARVAPKPDKLFADAGQGPAGWPATGLRPGSLPAAACGGVRHQPAQAASGGGHSVRQARRALPGHGAHRRDQRMAMTFETRPSSLGDLPVRLALDRQTRHCPCACRG